MNTALAATAAAANAAHAAVAPHDLIAHRAYLLRFALRRLSDHALAEDAVHDVLEAVLTGRAVFGGRSQLRSWLTGVLKHKIVDLVRERAAYTPLEPMADGEEAESVWASEAPGPERIAEDRERLAQTLVRIEALPGPLRDATMLRLVHDEPSGAVCRRLGISENNLFVRLHRARRMLLS